MTGLDNLPIYHERQEEGSMLCAQHALNSLLQGHYFTAPDLSEIAQHLDALEESYDDDNYGTRSGNMDDSGFFSVQVLENALKVWGFSLARWRGEEMRPFQDHPETQLAFILNFEQHWFTLRRVGPHWFNLNSFSAKPEWISKLYLGMVLQQAETEGYSVFAVTPIDPSSPALPHTEVDDLANTIPEPNSASTPNLESFTSHSSGAAPIAGIEDEDYELQAALHASLMGVAPEDPPPVIRHNVPLPVSESESSSSSRYATPQESLPMDVDPVQASMERNRLLLERMKAEQEYARNQLRTEGENDEDQETEEEMIRRAIEESEAASRGLERTDSDVSEATSAVIPEAQPHFGRDRVYDDDDAELQAALKASLEEIPEGWALPEERPLQVFNRLSETSDVSRDSDATEPDVESPANERSEPDVELPPAEEVSVDELRRRRLARFGS
ncbi:Josephin-domain-containing protein [Mycena pura]|uniref:ubiquitinyl hydrolase 1 n=1 Tax=Mycena pura TaxID=153505 RepID=A0AAD6VRF5_9AGAR|nr:Josephin-domain-containing protein [Mycena pura]